MFNSVSKMLEAASLSSQDVEKVEGLGGSDCFLCSVPLYSEEDPVTEETSPRKRRKVTNKNASGSSFGVTPPSKLLLQYLLSGSKKRHFSEGDDQAGSCAGLLEKALELMKNESEAVRFCSRCQNLAEQVLQLHLELEVVQMRIVEKLKEVKGVVGAGDFGSNVKEIKISEAEKHPVLVVRKDIRASICDRDFQKNDVPLVLLERMLPSVSTLRVSSSIDNLPRKVRKSAAKARKAWMDEEEEQLDDDLEATNTGAALEDNDFSDFNNEEDLDEDYKPPVEFLLEDNAKARVDSLPEKTPTVKKSKPQIKKTEGLKVEEPCGERWKAKLTLAQQHALKIRMTEGNNHRLTPTSSSIGRIFKCKQCSAKKHNLVGFHKHLKQHESRSTLNDQDKPHSCPDCKQRFAIKQMLDIHITYFCGDLGSRCDLCSKLVAPMHMKSHLEAVHSSSPIYECEYCHFYFGSILMLVAHSEKHPIPRFKCPLCPPSTKDFGRVTMVRHLYEAHQIGDPDSVLKCEEPECSDMVFFSARELLIHQEGIHLKKYVCPECGVSVTQKANLQHHIQRHHANDKRICCDQCTERFFRKQELSAHKMAKHGAPKFKCDLCTGEFTCKQSLNIHRERKHTPGAFFGCKLCSKKFRKQTSLDKHMQAYHPEGQSFVCETCGFTTKSSFILKRHIKYNHDPSSKIHQCSHCPAAFVNKVNLITHIRRHTNERPFQCEVCGKGFINKMALSSHQKVHQPKTKKARELKLGMLKNVDCPYCGGHYTTGASLRRHMLRWCPVRPDQVGEDDFRGVVAAVVEAKCDKNEPVEVDGDIMLVIEGV